MSETARQDTAIMSAADTLLAVCALQTGTDPSLAVTRALEAIAWVVAQAQIEQEANGGG